MADVPLAQKVINQAVDFATNNPTLTQAAATGAAIAGVAKFGKSAVLPVAGTAAGAALATKFIGPDAAARFRNSLGDTISSEDRKLSYEQLANKLGMQDTPFNYPQHKIFIVNNFVEGAGAPALVLEAWLPEQVSLDVSAQYEPLFGDGVFNENDVASKGARLFGFSGVTRNMSYKTWRSSSSITMQVPITFALDDTKAGIGGDIVDQILALQRMCLPSMVKGQAFLSPPGSPIHINENLVNDVIEAGTSAIQNVASATTNALSEASTAANQGDYLRAASSIADISVAAVTGVQSIFEKVAKLDRWTSVYIGNFLYFDKVLIDSVGSAYDMQLDVRGKPIKATVNLQFTTLFDPTVQDLNSIYLKGYNNTPTPEVGTNSTQVVNNFSTNTR